MRWILNVRGLFGEAEFIILIHDKSKGGRSLTKGFTQGFSQYWITSGHPCNETHYLVPFGQQEIFAPTIPQSNLWQPENQNSQFVLSEVKNE